MSVAIRKMTYEEFAQFYQWSVEQQAKERMEALHISREDAIKSAIAEISEMLPDGFHTKHHQLMTVVAEDENAGFIWTLHEETNGRMQSFICDFAFGNRSVAEGTAPQRCIWQKSRLPNPVAGKSCCL